MKPTVLLMIKQGKPRQMTLLNLGRHFAVDQDLWATLCVRIEQLLSHQVELLPIELPTTVEKAAQRIAAKLIEQRAVVIKPPLADEGHSIAPVESVATETA
jgi:glycerol-3-phosphate responsive antiterminator